MDLCDPSQFREPLPQRVGLIEHFDNLKLAAIIQPPRCFVETLQKAG